MGKSVLLAVDGSDNSWTAFRWYCDNIHEAGNTVIICHIPEKPHLPTFTLREGLTPPVEEWKKVLKATIDKVNQVESEYAQELILKKMPHTFSSIHGTTPGEGIVHVAEKEKVDLIVMGSKGLNILGRTLLGSVCEYVTRHCKVAVLMCPKPKKRTMWARIKDRGVLCV